MSTKKSRLILVMLSVLLIITMTACNTPAPSPTEAAPTKAAETSTTAPASNENTETAQEPTASGADKSAYYEVDVFSELANYAGEQSGWFAQILKDKFNMGFNIAASNLEGGESKFATMMAAGDIGEIIAFGDSGDHYRNAISANLLLDWTKDGLLDNYGSYIKETYPEALEMNRVTFGNGSAVYGLGHNLSTDNEGPGEGIEFTWGPYLRWDLYEQLGYPEIKTMDDYLPVIQQMIELEPTTPDGRPVYGFSMWGDWDGAMMTCAKQFACMYGYNDDTGSFVLVHANEDKYQDLLDINGYYYRTLKMYFDANQMKLVDPDSISQKFDDVSNKIKLGQVLFSWFSWLRAYNMPENTEEGRGLMLVPFEEEVMYSYGMTIYGGNRTIAIGSKAKYPDRIMELYNWLYTTEGAMVTSNGPEGLLWNYENGKSVPTELGFTAYLDEKNTDMPAEYGGGTYSDGKNQINFPFVNSNTTNPTTGEPYSNNMWKARLEANPNQVTVNWRKKMGVLSDHEYFANADKIAVKKVLFTGDAPEIISPDLEQKRNSISPIIVQNSWKMVFAKDEAEFNSLYNEMVTKAEGLGYREVVDWYILQAEKEFADRKK